ncbi:hypothetical protein QR680_018082 [Steinernema hermaphroditum]|uniref:DNA2/NAM7 helicase-like C-terminal domain-containing protein n=1 Tax=Steinernema hermaphroditum TaxID=289476 RepID=A0AA39HGU7_9BILA|nr:hypothetical protein QR680_018082 [Steinernema hermaphroditum]
MVYSNEEKGNDYAASEESPQGSGGLLERVNDEPKQIPPSVIDHNSLPGSDLINGDVIEGSPNTKELSSDGDTDEKWQHFPEDSPFVVHDYVPDGFVLSNIDNKDNLVFLPNAKVDSRCDLVVGDVIDLSFHNDDLNPPLRYEGSPQKWITRTVYESINKDDKNKRKTKTIYGVKDQNGQLIITHGSATVRVLNGGKEVTEIKRLGTGVPFAFDIDVDKDWTAEADGYCIESTTGLKKEISNLRCEAILVDPYGPTGAHLQSKERCRLDAHRLLLGKYVEAFKDREESDFSPYKERTCRWTKSSAYRGHCDFGEGLPKGYAIDTTILMQTLGKDKKQEKKLRAKITMIGDTWFHFRVEEAFEKDCAVMYAEDYNMIHGVKFTVQLIDVEKDELISYIEQKLEANLGCYAAETDESKVGAAERGLRLLRNTEIVEDFKPTIIGQHNLFKVGEVEKRLDKDQQRAIDSLAFHERPPKFSVLTACPGTGKTLCAAATVQANATKDGLKKVQVVLAMTNYAVDHMAEALHKIGGFRILRIYSSSARRKLNEQEPEYGLNSIIKALMTSIPANGSKTPTRETEEVLHSFKRNEVELDEFEKKGIKAGKEKRFEELRDAEKEAVEAFRTKGAGELKKLKQIKAEREHLVATQKLKFEELKEQRRQLTKEVYDIVMEYYCPHVILTTTDSYLRYRLKHAFSTSTAQTTIRQDTITGNVYKNPFEVFFESSRRVSRLLVEEASQLDLARFTVLMALNRNTEQIVLVGDPKQMPPFFSVASDSRLREYGSQSVLDMLLENEHCVHFKLKIGYRSHPDLQKLTALFYPDLKRKDFPNAQELWENNPDAKWDIWVGLNRIVPSATEAPPKLSRGPLQFRLIRGQSEKNNSFSQTNRVEAKVALKLIQEALACDVKRENIGVICIYAGQAALMRTELNSVGIDDDDIEVATVDSFQGREKHYILLLTTRTEGTTVGEWSEFIRDERRMNVATSRAIHGMIILGSAWMENVWKMVFQYCSQNRLIHEDTQYVVEEED